LFLYSFFELGVLLPVPDRPQTGNTAWTLTSRTLTEECVLRIGALGVTLMAVLSGFGSICASWETYLAPNRIVSEADVVRAKTSVEMTQDLINERRRKIALLEDRIHEKV